MKQFTVLVFALAAAAVSALPIGLGYNLKGLGIEEELALEKSMMMEKELALQKGLGLGYPYLGLGKVLYGSELLNPMGVQFVVEKRLGLEKSINKGLGLAYGGLYF